MPKPQDAHESLAIEGFVAMGSFVERSHLLTAVSVLAKAWRYCLHRRHARACSCVCDRLDKRRKDTETSEFDKERQKEERFLS